MNKESKLLQEPIKRKILEQLMKKEMTFSQLLNKAGIRDHGQLNYHLKLMIKNKLIEKSNGLYSANLLGKRLGVYINQFGGRETYPIPVLCAIVYNDKDEILLLRRNKHPEKGKWSFPAGKLLFGKNINYSVRKALYEETSLKLKPKKVFGFFPVIKTSNRKIIYHVLLIPVLMEKTSSKKIMLNDEHDSFEFLSEIQMEKKKLVAFDKEILKQIKNKGFRFKEFGVPKAHARK